MPTIFDLLYVAAFAVGLPLYGYFIFLPGFERRVRESPERARWQLWISSTVELWLIVGAGAALWVWFDRPWSALKFTMPVGWRLAVAVAVLAAYSAYLLSGIARLRNDATLRAQVRAGMGGDVAHVLPRTRGEMGMFVGVSVTAGFCEEFLFRGFFIWALSPWLGWWGAAALSVLCFGLGHAYQGWGGILKTGIFGALYTWIVWLTDSLWPAIAWHVLVDVLNGAVAWIALREAPPLPQASE